MYDEVIFNDYLHLLWKICFLGIALSQLQSVDIPFSVVFQAWWAFEGEKGPVLRHQVVPDPQPRAPVKNLVQDPASWSTHQLLVPLVPQVWRRPSPAQPRSKIKINTLRRPHLSRLRLMDNHNFYSSSSSRSAVTSIHISRLSWILT